MPSGVLVEIGGQQSRCHSPEATPQPNAAHGEASEAHDPARDAHDTFFIKSPASTLTVPEDYYERVKTMHESGGHGSIGYRYDFKQEEAFKNLLRTHTTV